MKVTIPVMKSASSMALRPIWSNGTALPEPVTWNGVTVSPGMGVLVVGVQYATIPRKLGETWTLIWLTLEGPEYLLPVVEFSSPNPKLMVAGIVRSASVDELHRQAAERESLANQGIREG